MKKSNNSIRTNYIYNLLFQLVKLILPIITMPYVSRILGAEGVGTYSYTLSIATYFLIFGNIGLDLYGKREIAYCQDDKETYSKIFWELLILKFITMFISTLFFVIFFCLKGHNAIYYRILILELVANCIDISWFYSGLEDFKKISIRSIIVKLFNVILIFCFVKTPNDTAIYLIIYVLSTFFGNFVLWCDIKKYLQNISIKELKIKRHIIPTIILFIPQIAIQIYTVLDKTMIGYILGNLSEVGYYEQSEKIVKILLTIVISLATVMIPRIANLYSNKQYNEIKKYMYMTFNFVFFVSFPLMFGISIIADSLVPIFLGNGYMKCINLIRILSPIIVFIGMSNIIGYQYLIATKKQKEYTISVVVGALVNFILNYLLLVKFKSYGAAIATCIAECLVTIIQLYYIRNEIKIKELFKNMFRYFISAILMTLICSSISFMLEPGIIKIATQTTIGCIVYLMFLYMLKDNFLTNIINNFKKEGKNEI